MIPSGIPRGLGNVATSTGHKGEKGRRREIVRLTELTRLENEAARLEQGLELRARRRHRGRAVKSVLGKRHTQGARLLTRGVGKLHAVHRMQGMVEVLVEPLLTDSNNWYVVAKPSSIATMEVGFLGGRETPEILVKEDFDRDVIWYKGRIVFGGAVLDYRGFYGAIVS